MFIEALRVHRSVRPYVRTYVPLGGVCLIGRGNARSKASSCEAALWRRCAQVIRSAGKNRSKIDRKIDGDRREIDENPFLGGFGRSKPLCRRVRARSGHARDGLKLPRSDLGTPKARQESRGSVQKSLRAGPKTLLDCCGAVSERVWNVERCRTQSQNDF